MRHLLLTFLLALPLALIGQSYQFDNYNNQHGLAQSQANVE